MESLGPNLLYERSSTKCFRFKFLVPIKNSKFYSLFPRSFQDRYNCKC